MRLPLEIIVALAAAMRADRAIGPANGLKVPARFVFVVKLRGAEGGHGYLLDPYTALGIRFVNYIIWITIQENNRERLPM